MTINQPGWIPGDSLVSVRVVHFRVTLTASAVAFMSSKQAMTAIPLNGSPRCP